MFAFACPACVALRLLRLLCGMLVSGPAELWYIALWSMVVGAAVSICIAIATAAATEDQKRMDQPQAVATGVARRCRGHTTPFLHPPDGARHRLT